MGKQGSHEKHVIRLTYGGPIYGEDGRERARLLAASEKRLDREVAERIWKMRAARRAENGGREDPKAVAVLTPDAFQKAVTALSDAAMLEGVDYRIVMLFVNGTAARGFMPCDEDDVTLGEIGGALTISEIPFKPTRYRQET